MRRTNFQKACQDSGTTNDSSGRQANTPRRRMKEFRGKTEGVDVNGVPCKLGDRDSMGHIVGFIDDDFGCWESIAERDGAITAGRYTDEMHEWERNGKTGPEPNPLLIAVRTCIDQDNVPHAVGEARDSWEFMLALRPIAREQMVEEIVERFRSLDNPSIHDLRRELESFLPRKLRDEE